MLDLQALQDKFPFLTILRCPNETYVGIVQNSDDKFITFYDINYIRTEQERKHIMFLGDTWWNESNRLLPISIFLSGQLTNYRYCLKTVSVKETEIVAGPIVSLNNLIKKRTKRRQIQLVRKMN